MSAGNSLTLSSILHIGKYYPPHRGGIESYVHDLAIRQAAYSRVHVVVANDKPRQETSIVDKVIVTRAARFGSVASMPICPGLVSAIKASPADLVHLHTPNPGAALAFLLSGHKGKLVITHHADTLGRRILRKISDPFVERVMKRASKIIVTSRGYLDSSQELLPYRQKCRVIPLGIDAPSRTSTISSEERPIRRGLGSRVILAIGRLVPYKGFDVLIRAMKYVDAELLLIGNGPLADDLQALADTEGVGHKASIMSSVHDLAPCFEAASVFVLPSITRAEAFGLVQVEAMAAGLPVINTGISSGVPEVSRDGQTGFTVPPGNEFALAEAINKLLDRPQLRTKFATAGIARAHEEFSADLMFERTMALYAEVLGGERALMTPTTHRVDEQVHPPMPGAA